MLHLHPYKATVIHEPTDHGTIHAVHHKETDPTLDLFSYKVCVTSVNT